MDEFVLLNDMLLEYLPSFAIKNPKISTKYKIFNYGGGMGIATYAKSNPINIRSSIGTVNLNKVAGYYVNVKSWEDEDGIINKKIILKEILNNIDRKFYFMKELEVNRQDVIQAITNIEKVNYGLADIYLYRFLLFNIVDKLKEYKIYDYRINSYLYSLKIL